MKYDDILKLEERTADNLYNIIFVKENNGWIRAHEWSAYLCDLIQDKLDIKNKLNILKKSYKPVEDGFVMNGLKLSSFSNSRRETREFIHGRDSRIPRFVNYSTFNIQLFHN